jgi:hypothetical protein
MTTLIDMIQFNFINFQKVRFHIYLNNRGRRKIKRINKNRMNSVNNRLQMAKNNKRKKINHNNKKLGVAISNITKIGINE